eukprot:CAMPEP_0117758414 /NCGR_PEP_ID=MMETSP0947-20121206/15364_1 /TAXON_ID=44440 /ORGANISM="Chattonella subsalsa, Strain CCMP2191" /LENGTH=255 /DNA_ID=CAMNT_0005578597 /DNA_START=75 /DNA_END=843 /DNA_ORIENTATION=+
MVYSLTVFLFLLLTVQIYGFQVPFTQNTHKSIVKQQVGRLQTSSLQMSEVIEQADSIDEKITTYCKCSKCTAIYPISAAQLGEKGRKVRCAVCAHEWFQATEKLQELWEGYDYEDFPEEEVKNIQERIKSGDFEKQTRQKKGEFTVFLGNLPFTFMEEEIKGLLESEGIEGVVSISVATDGMNRSRGFGFIEMATVKEGRDAIDRLSDLNIEGRPLSGEKEHHKAEEGGEVVEEVEEVAEGGVVVEDPSDLTRIH